MLYVTNATLGVSSYEEAQLNLGTSTCAPPLLPSPHRPGSGRGQDGSTKGMHTSMMKRGRDPQARSYAAASGVDSGAGPSGEPP